MVEDVRLLKHHYIILLVFFTSETLTHDLTLILQINTDTYNKKDS